MQKSLALRCMVNPKHPPPDDNTYIIQGAFSHHPRTYSTPTTWDSRESTSGIDSRVYVLWRKTCALWNSHATTATGSCKNFKAWGVQFKGGAWWWTRNTPSVIIPCQTIHIHDWFLIHLSHPHWQLGIEASCCLLLTYKRTKEKSAPKHADLYHACWHNGRARGMIILFSPQWAWRLEKKGKRKGLRHACSDSKRAVATLLVKSNRHPAFREGQVGFFFFFLSFFLFPLFSGWRDESYDVSSWWAKFFAASHQQMELTRLLVQGEQQGV